MLNEFRKLLGGKPDPFVLQNLADYLEEMGEPCTAEVTWLLKNEVWPEEKSEGWIWLFSNYKYVTANLPYFKHRDVPLNNKRFEYFDYIRFSRLAFESCLDACLFAIRYMRGKTEKYHDWKNSGRKKGRRKLEKI